MNPGSMQAGNEFQDLCSRGFDQALGIEKASFSALVGLSTCANHIYRNGVWFTPLLGNMFDTAAEAVVFCMELQMYWLTLMAPLAFAPAAVAGNAQPAAEVLAHSMDIAIGERFIAPDSTVPNRSGMHTPSIAEVPERSAGLALGARVGG